MLILERPVYVYLMRFWQLIYSGRAISTHLSTAALDKSKQSQERSMNRAVIANDLTVSEITLDLGFSAFFIDAPENIKGNAMCHRVCIDMNSYGIW